MKKTLGTAILALFATAAQAETSLVQVWEVDYSGKPPYSRSLQTLPMADVARMETESSEMVEVRTVDFSGRPPFNRGVETLRVVDAAQLEAETGERSVPGFRKRPPFIR